MVNAINISRLHNLYNKTLFYFKYNKLTTIHDNFKFSLYLKNLYFIFLYDNIEYTLIFFFFNLDKIFKLLKTEFFDTVSERLISNFLYRYYFLTAILDHDRYKD